MRAWAHDIPKIRVKANKYVSMQSKGSVLALLILGQSQKRSGFYTREILRNGPGIIMAFKPREYIACPCSGSCATCQSVCPGCEAPHRHICLECEICSSCVGEAAQKRETSFCIPSVSPHPSGLALECSPVPEA